MATESAPLEPSKVTVEITDWEDFRPGDVVVQNPDADRVEGAPFLVERHQPAPEPEPEWKQGAVYAAVQKRPGPDRVERYWSTYSSEDGVMLVNDVGSEFEPHELDDVRPLVVIDRATVDVPTMVADVRRLNPSLTIGEARQAVRTALTRLGIEAP